eukprot:676033-Karenia_brevis.AAC.1
MACDLTCGTVPAGKRIGPLTDVMVVALSERDHDNNPRHGLVGKVDGVDIWKYNFPPEGDNRAAW